MYQETRELEAYLVVKAKGAYGLSPRITTRPPALAKDEIAIKIDVKLPDALFTRPQLQAKIVVPHDAVTAPVVDATVLDNVQQVLQQQTGFDVSVRLVEPI